MIAEGDLMQTCSSCKGTGKELATPPARSGGSFGPGQITTFLVDERCTLCKGTGKQITEEGKAILELLRVAKIQGRM